MPIEVALAARQHRVDALRAQLAAHPIKGRPVSLELGCGHGHFLTAYAATHAAEFCVGVDLLRERLERAKKKAGRMRLDNVSWVKGDADEVLSAWPDDLRVKRHIFILFPDPWPKRRHWKNRLIQREFLSQLAARCAPGARLCFRTDHAPYFAAARAEIAEHSEWDLDGASVWPHEVVTVFQARAPSYESLVATRR
jgi:tRNA (guanine-N7-)-methyltransferase